MSLMIAGERSGVGKTTVTLALLSALKRRGSFGVAHGANRCVQSFKVGPDYIDPMFHRHVTGRACRNLDPVLTSEAYVQECFARHTAIADYAIVEGVMGLFDGAAGKPDFASTAHIARLLNLPILLVLDCGRLSQSIAALVHGYRSWDPRLRFAGVVLNRVGSDRHLDILKSALAPLEIPILGVLRRQDHIQIPDRHLGLVPTGELSELNAILDRLADLGETCFDWSRLEALLAADLGPTELRFAPSADVADRGSVQKSKVRIAIAQDAAFNFYYEDNLELLEHFGAELVSWSPLTEDLPDAIDGLCLGGGFPEMFAQTLSDNQSARNAVCEAIRSGMPVYAECGGLMYLCEKLVDFSGTSFPMVGILPTTAVMGSRLTLGYRTGRALKNTSIVEQGEVIHGHEFHRSHLTTEPSHPLFDLSSLLTPHSSLEGWTLNNLHASYLHLHWGSTPQFPKRFVQQCAKFRLDRYP